MTQLITKISFYLLVLIVIWSGKRFDIITHFCQGKHIQTTIGIPVNSEPCGDVPMKKSCCEDIISSIFYTNKQDNLIANLKIYPKYFDLDISIFFECSEKQTLNYSNSYLSNTVFNSNKTIYLINECFLL